MATGYGPYEMVAGTLLPIDLGPGVNKTSVAAIKVFNMSAYMVKFSYDGQTLTNSQWIAPGDSADFQVSKDFQFTGKMAAQAFVIDSAPSFQASLYINVYGPGEPVPKSSKNQAAITSKPSQVIAPFLVVADNPSLLPADIFASFRPRMQHWDGSANLNWYVKDDGSMFSHAGLTVDFASELGLYVNPSGIIKNVALFRGIATLSGTGNGTFAHHLVDYNLAAILPDIVVPVQQTNPSATFACTWDNTNVYIAGAGVSTTWTVAMMLLH